MLTRAGPFRCGKDRWVPTVCYVFPTVAIVMESNPRYWRIEFRWLWYGFDCEWWPKEAKK